MRLTINLCHKRGCTNRTRSGMRFCSAYPNCGKLPLKKDNVPVVGEEE